MPIALLMFPSACAARQLRKVRTSFGSRVRRSLPCMFLIDADLAQGPGKKYYREYYRSQRFERAYPVEYWLAKPGKSEHRWVETVALARLR